MGRRALAIYTALAFVLIYLPIAMVVLMSFTQSTLARLPIPGLTLEWYAGLLENRRMLEAFYTSLKVAVPATFLSTAFGLCAALAIVRHRFFGRRAFMLLTSMPMLAPGVVLGIAILLVFRTLGLPVGFPAILAGHTVLGFPYATFIIIASLVRFDRNLEDAARSLGASEADVFFRITLPGILPGILGAALFAFTISIGEFVVTFFLTSPGTTTLPVRIFSIVKTGITPEINALSTLILAATFVAVIGALFLTRDRRKRPHQTKPGGAK